MNLLPAMHLQDRPTNVSGNVTVHPTAQVATGVMLRADPDSQLIIGAGACIGWGCVLHAHNGTLVIGEGVILGMGTLVVGNSQVGDYACIGAATTVLNSIVRSQAVIPPNSLISATVGRAVPLEAIASGASETIEQPVFTPRPTVQEAVPEPQPLASPVARDPTTAGQLPSPDPAISPIELPIQVPEVPKMPVNLTINAPIYGKKSLERLLATLRNEKPDLE